MNTKKVRQIVLFLISGSATAAFDLILLYLFTHLFGWYYLLSATIAYALSILFNFTCQKFLTFKNYEQSPAVLRRQLFLFICVGVINLLLNTLLLKRLVDVFHVWYMGAQMFTLLFLACFTFFIYKIVIFVEVHDDTHS